MTTNLKISHGNINNIVNAIHTSITTYLSDKDDNDNIQWRRTWDKWKTAEKPHFTSIRRRKELAQFVYGHDDGSPQTKTIVQEIFRQIPILNEIYQFTTNSITNQTFMTSNNVQNIEFARKQTVIEATRNDESGEEQVETWSEVASNSKHSSPAREQRSIAMKFDKVPTENRFEIFLDDDEDKNDNVEEVQPTTETLDRDVQSPLTLPPSLNTSPDSANNDESNTINSPNNQSKISEIRDDTTTILSQNKIKLITELIKALKENNVEANDVIKWINDEATDEYNNIVAIKIADFAEEASKIEKTFGQRIKDTLTVQLEKISKTHSDHVRRVLQENAKIKQTCSNTLASAKSEVSSSISNIRNEETNAVLHLSTKVNEYTQALEGSIKLANETMEKLNSLQKFATTHNAEMNRLKQHIETTIASSFQTFKDQISQYSEDEQQEYYDFLAHHDSTVKKANIAQTTLEEQQRILNMEKDFFDRTKERHEAQSITNATLSLTEVNIIKTDIDNAKVEIGKLRQMQFDMDKFKNLQQNIKDSVDERISLENANVTNSLRREYKSDLLTLEIKLEELQQTLENVNTVPSHHNTMANILTHNIETLETRVQALENIQPTSHQHKSHGQATFTSTSSDVRVQDGTIPSSYSNKKFPAQKFFLQQHVLYRIGTTHLEGRIDKCEYNEELEMWIYNIATTMGSTMHDCYEINITKPHKRPINADVPRSNAKTARPFSPIFDRDEDSLHFGRDEEDTTNTSVQEIKLADNQYIWPIGDSIMKRSIFYSQLSRHAEKWDFELNNKYDLFTFYEKLANLLTEFNILLKPYHDITDDESIAAITKSTCLNYDKAFPLMSRTLFSFLSDNKDTIFATYTPPLSIISAFSADQDGFGCLKYILRAIHPKLKHITDTSTHMRPQFTECADIHVFINRIRHWLADEKVLGRSQYSDVEKLNFILDQLDSRFETAKSKIQNQLNEVYHDRLKPGTFPSKLKLDYKESNLGLYIIELLPPNQRKNLENAIKPQVNKMDRRNFNNNNSRRRDKGNFKKGEWAKEIKWKKIPGAICAACGRTDHDVYQTGCNNLAMFCACQAFVRQHSKEEIQPVIDSYNRFMRERTKKNKVKKDYKNIIRKITTDDARQEDIDDVKDTLHRHFIELYEDEKDNPTPFDDIAETDDDDDSDSYVDMEY